MGKIVEGFEGDDNYFVSFAALRDGKMSLYIAGKLKP